MADHLKQFGRVFFCVTFKLPSFGHIAINSSHAAVSTLKNKYNDVFQPCMGEINEVKAYFSLKPETVPNFRKFSHEYDCL